MHFVLKYPLTSCPILILPLCFPCSEDTGWLCNGLSVTLPHFISDWGPLFPCSGNWWRAQLVGSWVHSTANFLECGVFSAAQLTGSWSSVALYNVFLLYYQVQGECFPCASQYISCTSWLPHKHFLQACTHRRKHMTHPLENKHILLNKGLTTAPHPAVLVQCLILWLIPLKLRLYHPFSKLRPHT